MLSKKLAPLGPDAPSKEEPVGAGVSEVGDASSTELSRPIAAKRAEALPKLTECLGLEHPRLDACPLWRRAAARAWRRAAGEHFALEDDDLFARERLRAIDALGERLG